MSDVRGATVAGQTPIRLSLFKEQVTSTPTDIATTPPSSINTKRLPSRPVTVLTVIPCWKNQKQIKINYFNLISPKRHTPPPPRPRKLPAAWPRLMACNALWLSLNGDTYCFLLQKVAPALVMSWLSAWLVALIIIGLHACLVTDRFPVRYILFDYIQA